MSPYWVPEAPLPGPRVPFCPNAGWWVDEVLCVLAAAVDSLVPDWELVEGPEFDPVYAGEELELPDEVAVDVGEGDGGGAALRLFDGC